MVINVVYLKLCPKYSSLFPLLESVQILKLGDLSAKSKTPELSSAI